MTLTMKTIQTVVLIEVLFCLVGSGSICVAFDRRISVSVTDADSGEALAARLF